MFQEAELPGAEAPGRGNDKPDAACGRAQSGAAVTKSNMTRPQGRRKHDLRSDDLRNGALRSDDLGKARINSLVFLFRFVLWCLVL